MKFIIALYELIINVVHLFRSGHSKLIKFKIIFILLKMTFKCFIFSFFGMKSERFLGYKIDAFNYDSIRFLFSEIFYKNEYFFKATNSTPLIIDAGANIGMATIYFKWLYPAAVIYAFEPDKDTFAMLSKNIERNKLQDVHLINAALSGKSGLTDFFIDNSNPGSLMMSAIKERMPKEVISVDSITLSDFIRNGNIKAIDLLKMDIEGSEREVMDDLSSNGNMNNINRLIIEYHHKIAGQKSCLANFLKLIEDANFEYQITTRNTPLFIEDKFQDVMLYAYRK